MRTIRWFLVVLAITLVAGLLGFKVLEGKAADAARLVFFIGSVIVTLLIILALASGPHSAEDA